MPYFAKRSKDNLVGVHPYLGYVLDIAIDYFDFSVVSGVRTKAEQLALYQKGRSKPGRKVTNIDGEIRRSSHQINPQTGYGHAVDIYPYPIPDLNRMSKSKRKKEIWRFVALAHFVKGIWVQAAEEGKVKGELRWGGDWDSDFDFSDQSFDDLPHLELNLKTLHAESNGHTSQSAEGTDS